MVYPSAFSRAQSGGSANEGGDSMDPKSLSRKGHSPLRIRPLDAADRPAIQEMVVSSGKFNTEEIATALELVEEALDKGEASGYLFAVLQEEGRKPSVCGYACYGPTPLTQGVYDLYWIVVGPSTQRRGYGKRLLEFVEVDVVRRGGRMVLIETSSQESYRETVGFYQQAGYALVARIRNFYRVGDDKLIFSKDLIPV
jgi:ribosomal protein S18 acetylase RimI-like enzyme